MEKDIVFFHLLHPSCVASQLLTLKVAKSPSYQHLKSSTTFKKGNLHLRKQNAHSREGKQNQKSLASYWKLEEKQRMSCSQPFLQLLSLCTVPVGVLHFSVKINSICHVPHVLLHFWKPQSFNCFLAFQWLCSVIQWMQTKMSGCYLQLTLVTNPSPETHELLGSGG